MVSYEWRRGGDGGETVPNKRKVRPRVEIFKRGGRGVCTMFLFGCLDETTIVVPSTRGWHLVWVRRGNFP